MWPSSRESPSSTSSGPDSCSDSSRASASSPPSTNHNSEGKRSNSVPSEIEPKIILFFRTEDEERERDANDRYLGGNGRSGLHADEEIDGGRPRYADYRDAVVAMVKNGSN